MNNINKSRTKFFQIIQDYDKFIITTHINPDGDGLGAEAALYHYLKFLNKDVNIINDDLPETKYNFLELPVHTKLDQAYVDNSVLIILDCNELNRINKLFSSYIDDFEKIIVIDHHRDPQLINNSIRIIDHAASSVCEIVYLLMENKFNELPHKLLLKMSQALYTGIIFDTNSFANSNVSEATYCIAGKLVDRGIDNTIPYKHIFQDKPNKKLRLLGETLSSLQEYAQGKIVIYKTTQKMLKRANATMEDASGFTKEVRPDGFREIVVYIRELKKNSCRVSLRSKKFNVQKVAKKFGGGGHKLAAGFRTEMDISALQKKLLDLILTDLS